MKNGWLLALAIIAFVASLFIDFFGALADEMSDAPEEKKAFRPMWIGFAISAALFAGWLL